MSWARSRLKAVCPCASSFIILQPHALPMRPWPSIAWSPPCWVYVTGPFVSFHRVQAVFPALWETQLDGESLIAGRPEAGNPCGPGRPAHAIGFDWCFEAWLLGQAGRLGGWDTEAVLLRRPPPWPVGSSTCSRDRVIHAILGRSDPFSKPFTRGCDGRRRTIGRHPKVRPARRDIPSQGWMIAHDRWLYSA